MQTWPNLSGPPCTENISGTIHHGASHSKSLHWSKLLTSVHAIKYKLTLGPEEAHKKHPPSKLFMKIAPYSTDTLRPSAYDMVPVLHHFDIHLFGTFEAFYHDSPSINITIHCKTRMVFFLSVRGDWKNDRKLPEGSEITKTKVYPQQQHHQSSRFLTCLPN